MKLYPPVLNNKLPAFFGNTIPIPFSLNRAGIPYGVTEMVLLLKTVQSNRPLTSLDNYPIGKINWEQKKVEFDIETAIVEKNYFLTGQYYKVQIAFKDAAGTIGHFSNAGIIKYTTKPIISIRNLEKSNDELGLTVPAYEYQGYYSQRLEEKYINAKAYLRELSIFKNAYEGWQETIENSDNIENFKELPGAYNLNSFNVSSANKLCDLDDLNDFFLSMAFLSISSEPSEVKNDLQNFIDLGISFFSAQKTVAERQEILKNIQELFENSESEIFQKFFLSNNNLNLKNQLKLIGDIPNALDVPGATSMDSSALLFLSQSIGSFVSQLITEETLKLQWENANEYLEKYKDFPDPFFCSADAKNAIYDYDFFIKKIKEDGVGFASLLKQAERILSYWLSRPDISKLLTAIDLLQFYIDEFVSITNMSNIMFNIDNVYLQQVQNFIKIYIINNSLNYFNTLQDFLIENKINIDTIDFSKIIESCTNYYNFITNIENKSNIFDFLIRGNELYEEVYVLLHPLFTLLEEFLQPTLDEGGGDITETLESYWFIVYDSTQKNILQESGEILHNSENDVQMGVSVNSWYSTLDFNKYPVCYIQFYVKTLNGLICSTAPYAINKIDTIDLNINATLKAELDEENGSIDLYFEAQSEKINQIHYQFLITRASSKDNYNTWEPLCKKELGKVDNNIPKYNFSIVGLNAAKIWTDYTVEQGYSYIYALQAYNENEIYSNKIYSNAKFLNDDENNLIYGDPLPVLVDFEHAYLFDGKKQLKLKFDPKISSLKNVVLEQKTDTIGSKYPFIFRNGQVNYKEFNISALISYLCDEDGTFTDCYADLNLYRYEKNNKITTLNQYEFSTNLNSVNIYREREFKLEVLNWLTNGEPKIFRSPTEGNYLVRLMNVSLSPKDELGRMLHSFSATAYEIDEYSFDNLRTYGFVDLNYEVEKTSIYFCQKILTKDQNLRFDNLLYLKLNPLQADSSMKTIKIVYNDQEIETVSFLNNYTFPSHIVKNISQIIVEEGAIEVIWGYRFYIPPTAFNYISNIKPYLENVQYFGGALTLNLDENIYTNENIINYFINDTLSQIGEIQYLKIYPRMIEKCWEEENVYYEQMECVTPLDPTYFLQSGLIYEVYSKNNNSEPLYYLFYNCLQQECKISYTKFWANNPYMLEYNYKRNNEDYAECFNFLNNSFRMTNTFLENSLKLDYLNQNHQIKTQSNIDATNINKIKYLRAGWGLMIELGYLINKYEYDFSSYNESLQKQLNFKYIDYKNAEKEYLTTRTEQAKKNYQLKYKLYESAVDQILKKIQTDERGG